MSRPVYYFKKETQYSQPASLEVGVWVFEFLASQEEFKELRKPRCLMLIRGSRHTFKVKKVKRLPGKPVNGASLIQVLAERLDV